MILTVGWSPFAVFVRNWSSHANRADYSYVRVLRFFYIKYAWVRLHFVYENPTYTPPRNPDCFVLWPGCCNNHHNIFIFPQSEKRGYTPIVKYSSFPVVRCLLCTQLIWWYVIKNDFGFVFCVRFFSKLFRSSLFCFLPYIPYDEYSCVVFFTFSSFVSCPGYSYVYQVI